jgi:dephospho-CoA kinase
LSVIGLLGGIACGKSTVSNILKETGAVVFDADQVALALLTQPDIINPVVDAFGAGVLDQSGKVSRKNLGSIVFKDHLKLKKLNQIVHPGVKKELESFLAENSKAPIVVLDAPLLLEANLQHLCHHLIFIETTPTFRTTQANQRNWDADELFRREEQQVSLQKKKEVSDFVLQNNGSIADLRKRVLAILDEISRSLQDTQTPTNGSKRQHNV